jgi:hypothetical protein
MAEFFPDKDYDNPIHRDRLFKNHRYLKKMGSMLIRDFYMSSVRHGNEKRKCKHNEGQNVLTDKFKNNVVILMRSFPDHRVALTTSTILIKTRSMVMSQGKSLRAKIFRKI